MSQNQHSRRMGNEPDDNGVRWYLLSVQFFQDLLQLGACSDDLALIDRDMAVGVSIPYFFPVGVEVFRVVAELPEGLIGQLDEGSHGSPFCGWMFVVEACNSSLQLTSFGVGGL